MTEVASDVSTWGLEPLELFVLSLPLAALESVVVMVRYGMKRLSMSELRMEGNGVHDPEDGGREGWI